MLCARGIYIYNKVIKWDFALFSLWKEGRVFLFGSGGLVCWFVGWVSAVGESASIMGDMGGGLGVGVGVKLASDGL